MRREQTGQVTAFVVVFTAALLLLGGLVLDGGLVLAAQRRVINEAEAAARAGAQALDISTYRSTGAMVLDPARASNGAKEYLAQTGHQGEVVATTDQVAVTVRFDQPMQILGVAGIGSITVTGQGVARVAHGVERAER